MEMQSVCTGITAPKLRLSANCLFSNEVVSASNVGLRCPRILLKPPSKWFSWSSLNRGAVICGSSSSNSNADTNLKISRRKVRPFNGKSGSVSFHGLTHQSVEEGRLVSAPFNEDKGSFVWFWDRLQIVTSLSFEAMFYFGLATFLTVTDRIQRPYLQFSSKRWGLITGLRGYLTSAFFVMGFKVIAPLFAVYRLYQLTKAAYFIEKLMFTLRGAPESALLLERSNALVSMIVTFQVLGLVCLWSLLTFLLRLFPSRPVAENY
ncbi:TRNA-processing ribonuclease BN [Salix suchowensis]|nr:TRNA-processing ribonuclease BN [Salix suchowensis]